MEELVGAEWIAVGAWPVDGSNIHKVAVALWLLRLAIVIVGPWASTEDAIGTSTVLLHNLVVLHECWLVVLAEAIQE